MCLVSQIFSILELYIFYGYTYFTPLETPVSTFKQLLFFLARHIRQFSMQRIRRTWVEAIQI